MYVHVTAAAVVLEEADDLGRFHVAVDGGVADVDATLRTAGWGRMDPDGDAYIAVDAIRTAAADRGPDWAEKFAAMLGYAASKGWLTEDGSAIQAHIE